MKKTTWKRISLSALAALMALTFCACGDTKTETETEGNGDTATTKMTGAISVISREDGSGTRGAFTELLGILDSNKKDATIASAEVTNSTAVMLTTVAGDKASIGYVSLGSLSSDVKALKIDGAEATVANIKSGSYKVARPFNLVYNEEKLSDLAKDFVSYIMSQDGQKVIADNGYISMDATASYKASGKSGKLTLSGSTSVAPVMEKLADAYKALNKDVTIEVQQTGSSAGITAAIEGTCDMGMSSRELKDEEAAKIGVRQIATDGIAVIVNKKNSTDNMKADDVRDIYLGTITTWDSVSK